MSARWAELPDHLLAEIFRRLPSWDRTSIRSAHLVCRSWRQYLRATKAVLTMDMCDLEDQHLDWQAACRSLELFQAVASVRLCLDARPGSYAHCRLLLGSLSKLPALQDLKLQARVPTDCEPVTSDMSVLLSCLVSLPALRMLACNATLFSNVRDLTGLVSLEALSLADTTMEDATPLSALRALTSLDLSYSYIANISPLTSLTNLRSLDLEESWVHRMAALEGLAGLTLLSLARLDVDNLTPLSYLTRLQHLILTDVQLDAVDVMLLADLGSLTKLETSGLHPDQLLMLKRGLPGTEICNYDVKSSSGDEGPFVVHDDAYDDSSQSDYWDDPDDFDEMFAMLGHGMMHA